MLRKIAFLTILFILAGCSSIPEDAAKALVDKGVLDVLKDAGDDKYDPPADERLTVGQVEMYLKVRKRELELAQAAAQDINARKQKLEEAKEGGGLSAAWEGLKAVGSVGDLITADIRAAQELGENTAEYMWIKGKVLEVSATALYEKGRNQLNSTLETQLERLKKAEEEAATDQQKEVYQAQIDALEQALDNAAAQSESADSKPSVAYNRELLARYQDALTAVDTELNKYRLLAGEEK